MNVNLTLVWADEFQIPVLRQALSVMCNYQAPMNRVLIFTIVLLISACSSTSKNKNLNNDLLVKPQLKASPKHQENRLNNRILGVWTDGNTENATFKISKDSIFYIEHLTNYKYFLKGNSLKIIYPDYEYLGKISFNGDTLVMTSDEGTSKLWKFNK